MDPRKCQNCQNEATVHEVTVRQGVRVERHLCESCAQEAGIPVHPSAPINDLIGKYILSQTQGGIVAPTTASPSSPTPAPAKPHACPGCALTFAEFKQGGLLGCAECYRAFESQLSGLIERAHGGATQHLGKQPRRMGGGEPSAAREGGLLEERARRQQLLRQQLEEAVRAEQYERAAKIRDEIHRFGDTGRTA
jgi:protein arginine kinase activator